MDEGALFLLVVGHVHCLNERGGGAVCTPQGKQGGNDEAEGEAAIILIGDDDHLRGDEIEGVRCEVADALKLSAEGCHVGEQAPDHQAGCDGREDGQEGVESYTCGQEADIIGGDTLRHAHEDCAPVPPTYGGGTIDVVAALHQSRNARGRRRVPPAGLRRERRGVGCRA